jgi:hypothetical protein
MIKRKQIYDMLFLKINQELSYRYSGGLHIKFIQGELDCKIDLRLWLRLKYAMEDDLI